MATAVETRVAPVTVVAVPAVPAKPVKAWLFGPWLDLFFVANLSWPLVALAALWGGWGSTWGDSSVVQSLAFWQIYFLSTPHRWITLGLVFFDEERFQQRPKAFVSIGLFFILFVTAVVLGTGTVVLLVAIDYFWNSWHFAAQHSGISRIYARTARPEEQTRGLWEKVLLRAFILFVLFRTGSVACSPNCGKAPNVQQPEFGLHLSRLLHIDLSALEDGLATFNRVGESWLDAAMLALPLALLAVEVYRYRRSCRGRLAYLTSVALAYTSLLLAVHYRQPLLVLAVALSISLFHATEYLAIVSWATIKKHARSRKGVFAHLVPRWGVALVTFMTVLALSGWMVSRHFGNEWAVLTIAVSYLHYAYDGMIWKARRPAPAPSPAV